MAGDGLEAAELLREVQEADGVAEDELGTARDADVGQVLAVSSCDGVEHAEQPLVRFLQPSVLSR